MNLQKVYKKIDEKFDEHLEQIAEYVRVDNRITNIENVFALTRMLKKEIEEMGGRASIMDYGELPIIFGEINFGADSSLLIYKNYDIIPPLSPRWKVHPFSAQIITAEGGEKVIMSRGISEPKGPLIATLNVLRTVIEEGKKLPVNIKFISDGDRQLGSPSLTKLISDRKKDFLDIKTVFVPKFSQSESGNPILLLGVKGLILIEMICSGGAWGGPIGESLHSSNASWIKSPVWRLIKALSTMVDENEKVLIKGFYDEVVDVIDLEERGIKSGKLEIIDFMRKQHAVRFKWNLPDEDLFRKHILTPTFNISNILVRPPAYWSKLILPSEARASIDIRLVPDMEPSRIIEAVRDHLREHGYDDIEVVTHIQYPAWSTDSDDPAVRIIKDVYKDFGFDVEIHYSSTWSFPFYAFQKELGASLVVGGLGRGGKAFSFNEYATLDGIKLFEKSVACFLDRFCKTALRD
ncbi:MAG: M20/M25/M40 family metallo-hydrolase [Acidobacteriota bacterium]